VSSEREVPRPGGGALRALSAPLRAIPSDHEAERAVLGALLLDHEALYKVQDKLRASAFDLPRHRILYDAICAIVEANQAISLITLRSFLEERQQLEAVGGLGFLSGVADSVVTAAHVEHHARIVREKAIGRALIRTCESLAARGYEGGQPMSDLLEEAERQVLAISEGHAETVFTTMKQEMKAAFDYIDKVQSGVVTGARTGFEEFDRMTGGLDAGELIVLAARPSMGKTALALNMARNHAVSDGGCVAFFSLEMTKRELVMRLLLGEARIDNSRFRNGMLGERDFRLLTRAASGLEQQKLYFDDSMAVTVSDIGAKARRLHREQKLSLIVIDYIQLVQGRLSSDERREQQVADISRSLKLLAKDLGVPVLALSQLNRGPEGRPDKRPMLADLRESGAIEQDADKVLFIYRDDVYNEDSDDAGKAEVIIAKQRNGPTGTVKLHFAREFGRFDNLARRDDAPPRAGFGPADDLDAGFGGDAEPPF
jgi:replicative DNA helicase